MPGFLDGLLNFASAATPAVAGYAQGQQVKQEREKQESLDAEKRDEERRRATLERALLALRVENEAFPEPDIPDAPTYGVGPSGPTASNLASPDDVAAFQERFPGQQEPPDPFTVNVDGIRRDVGSEEEARALRDRLSVPDTPDPTKVTETTRRNDNVTQQIVQGFRSDARDLTDAAQGFVAMQGAESALAEGNPAGAIALLFAYGKVLDPGSVVREGELATLQRIGAVDDRVKNWLSMAQNGTLSPEAAKAIMDSARAAMVQREGMFTNLRNNALNRAEVQGLGRDQLDQILPDPYSSFREPSSASSGTLTPDRAGGMIHGAKEPWQARAEELRAQGLDPQQVADQLRSEGLIGG